MAVKSGGAGADLSPIAAVRSRVADSDRGGNGLMLELDTDDDMQFERYT